MSLKTHTYKDKTAAQDREKFSHKCLVKRIKRFLILVVKHTQIIRRQYAILALKGLRQNCKLLESIKN